MKTPTDRASEYAKEMVASRGKSHPQMPEENKALTDWINGFSAGKKELQSKLTAANERIKELEAEINSLQCECDSGTQCQACFLKEALTPPERGEE